MFSITREIIINGESQNHNFDLTGIEQERAFNTEQYRRDTDQVYAALREQEYERMSEVPENLIEEMAQEFRTRVDGMLKDIMIEIIRKHEDDLAEYKTAWKVYEVEVTRTTAHTYTVRAKNDDDAQSIMEDWVAEHESEIDWDMESEISDYEYGYACECEGWKNPDHADITVE